MAVIEVLTGVAANVAKGLAKKALESLKGELGEAAIEEAKKLVDAKIERDKEALELARKELEAWQSAFGALPPGTAKAAQIIRASVRPFLTVFVTIEDIQPLCGEEGGMR